MSKLKQLIGLQSSNLSVRALARALDLSIGAVSKYLRAVRAAGVGAAEAESQSEAELEPRVFGSRRRRRPGHWCRRTQFCAHYHDYRRTLARSMRQIHRAGEKVFIDYSGDTVAVIDSTSGEILTAEIFVATLGASKYAYAEASWTQTLPWIASNIRMLEFFGAVPSLWIPDNLKAAIKKACRYEPEATPTYEDCARHYGAAILPARPYHAKDKASVEMSVLVVQRWFLARLRNRQFFSLRELNAAIAELLVDLNRRPFKKLPGCRAEAFQSIDRPAIKPLPATRYEYAK